MVLAITGAAHIVSTAASLGVSRWSTANVTSVREVRSPDGQYRAVLHQSEGGGAFSPFCTQAVLIVPSGENLTASKRLKDYEVYSTDACDSFADHAASPDFLWIDSRDLRIRFSINHASGAERNLRLRKRDASGAVTVHFLVSQ